MLRLLFLITLLCNDKVNTDFNPDVTDYDAYGLKIAANDVLFVEANGNGETFLVQFTPYNYTFGSLQCTVDYDDPTHYVYSVGVGIQQNTNTTNPYFYFAGEVVSNGYSTTDALGNNGTFIGIWINEDPQPVSFYVTSAQSVPCYFFQTAQLQFLESYDHQEFFVIAVEPYGQYAIGLATDFAFIYYPFPNGTITTKSSTDIWPSNTTFNPCAADASDTFTIVAGFVKASADSRVRATPTVYLIRNTNLTILSTWSYTAANNSWQSRLTYSGADSWSNRYTMSVKINSNDPTRVLVGMPFLNTVFLFVIGNNHGNVTLTLASSAGNGQFVGYGKSVTWLTYSQAAILVSTYSIDYDTWYSSQIYFYTSLNGTTLPSSPTAVIPNSQQPIPSTINSNFIRMVSTPESVAVLDIDGGVLIILAESPGYYASTDTTKAPIAASMPVVSYSTVCIAGNYKSDSGVHPCILCSSGTRNPGGIVSTSCINCSSTSFCPLGAIYEVDSSLLISLSQSYAYPRSPDLDTFDDILIMNMFSIGSSSHCIVVSPIFWTIILLSIIFVLLIAMSSLNWCVQAARRDRWRSTVKNIFQRTDLLGEGEIWIGGLASLAIILMAAFAYAFSISYMNQYPSEKAGPSTFACDTTIRNAQFESNLRSLAVPVSDEEGPIFDLLNAQNFTLQLDFINTVASCSDLSISEVTESSTVLLIPISCSNINGTLSTTIRLSEHDTTIVVTVDGIDPIGGVRVGLSGPGSQGDSQVLQKLNFYQTFYSQSPRTLSQTPTIYMTLTKVVNETESFSGGESEFAGIWYPTFTYSFNQMFITSNTYIMSNNLTSTTLTIVISETSYYIKNVQSPIARKAEIVFRTLLFTILCLEIAALVFVLCKLLIIPLYNKLTQSFCQRNNKVEPTDAVTSHHD